MDAQYIESGVLVRPVEAFATNFLSSRYYDGRGIVDLLESPESASRWMRVVGGEIAAPIEPFAPSETELERLRSLRDGVEATYRTLVDGSAADSASALREVLDDARIAPTVGASADRVAVSWAASGSSRIDELVAAVAVSAASTVTGHVATLLRKCEAPRCVLYYTRHNSRQHWCSSVCGNRARVARAARGRRTGD